MGAAWLDLGFRLRDSFVRLAISINFEKDKNVRFSRKDMTFVIHAMEAHVDQHFRRLDRCSPMFSHEIF